MAITREVPLVPPIDEFLHELARLRLLAFLAVLKRADFVYLLRHSGLIYAEIATTPSLNASSRALAMPWAP